MKQLLSRLNRHFEAFTRRCRDGVRYSIRRFYFPTLRKLIGPGTSVIGNNCLVGRFYKDLGYQYRTPTVGLFFFFPDYILFLRELEQNLRAPLRFVERSKYMDTAPNYPVGVIGEGIEIHFLHYPSAAQAERDWRERAARVDINNLVVVAQEQRADRCTPLDIKAFGELPFRYKFFFTVDPYPLPDTYFVRKFHRRGHFPNPYRKVLPIYRQLVRYIRSNASKI